MDLNQRPPGVFPFPSKDEKMSIQEESLPLAKKHFLEKIDQIPKLPVSKNNFWYICEYINY